MNSLSSLIDPGDPIERQYEKLLKINQVLMRRVEQSTDDSGAAYQQFQRAAMLEEEVRRRTRELEHALDLLNESNAQLAEANRETEAARQNLANAIETIQEGFALFSPDEELVMCNSRFGMHMPDIRDRMVPGLTFENYVDLVSQSQFLDLPEGETPEKWKKRRMARHKDAHVIFNARMIWSRWVQVSEHRTRDGGTVILQTDVTDIMRLERQERERLLDDQARLIRATLEHLNQGVCIFDSSAQLAGWNQKVGELLSLPAHLFRIGTRFATLFDRFSGGVTFSEGVSPESIYAWINQPMGRKPVSFEIMQGANRILAVHAQEMPDGGFVISFTDITTERQAVQAIRNANEMLEQRVAERTLELEDALNEAERANASKSRFVAAASHDLLQPLSAAKLYLASVIDDKTDDPAQSVLNKAGRALESVENILEALLDISKLDSGKAELRVMQVSLGALLGQLQEEMGPLARQKGLDLRIMLTDAVVVSDPTYLRRILQNLIANAIRYTTQGKVLVGARRREKSMRIEVWDTGPGIPEEEQDAIFGEFRRLNAAASAAEGMGLGLAIVERACGLLNHPLSLQSVVGQGTVFRVECTLSDHELPNQFTSARPLIPVEEVLENLLVLLIEDNADMRHALTVMLENWGVSVLPAENPAEAQDLLAEIGIAPDAILADYQLADGIRGTNVVADLWAIHGELPAAIITANRTPDVVTACGDLGIPLFHKPIEPATLRNFLSKLKRVEGLPEY